MNSRPNQRKNNVIQVRRDPNGEWVDFTKPCYQKLAIEFALKAKKWFGCANVRWITVSNAK